MFRLPPKNYTRNRFVLMADQFALEMYGISKKFPGVCALDDVDLVVKKG